MRALMHAIIFLKVDFARYLILLGMNVNETLHSDSLIFYSSLTHSDIVKVLIERGIDLSLRDELGQTRLCVASSGGDLNVLLLPLEAKFNLSFESHEALAISTAFERENWKEVILI